MCALWRTALALCPPFVPQVNSPLAASTPGAARSCACSPTKATSTALAEGAESSRRTSPAGVREGVREEDAGGGLTGTQLLLDPPKAQLPEPFTEEKLRMTSVPGERRTQVPGSPGLWLTKVLPSPPAVNSSCRVQDEFECANGECINFSLTCDGVSHCKDKSDEKPSYCSKEPPPPPGPRPPVTSLGPQ